MLVEDDDARWKHYACMVGGRLSVEELKTIPQWERLAYLGPPGLFQSFNEWKEHMAETHFLQPGEDYMVDLDHHPKTKGCVAGREFPCLLTHGSICSMSQTEMRMATSRERFASLGFHCHERLCSQWNLCALFPVLEI